MSLAEPSASVKSQQAVLAALEKHDGRISTDELAAELSVNRITVIRTIKVLKADGRIVLAEAGCGRGHVARYTLVKGCIPNQERVTKGLQRVTSDERVTNGLNTGDKGLQKGDIERVTNAPGPRARGVSLEVEVLEVQELKTNPPIIPPITAQTMVANLIDDARDAGVEMPRNVIGQFASQIKKLLDEGIAPEKIKCGIEAMIARRRIIPSSLPNFVMEASLPAAKPKPARFGRGLSVAQILEGGRAASYLDVVSL